MKNTLGIIGGLGPKASAYFYDMITTLTDAKCDQDHLNIILLSHPSIPDRTEYILDNSKNNPYPYLLDDVKTLEMLGVKMIAIPCNTSCYFHSELQKNTNVVINNMIDDTIAYLKEKNIQKVGILATTGTINSKLYQNACIKYNIDFVIPDNINQKKLMSIIYDNLKGGNKINLNNWHDVVSCLDAEYIILGCTELSCLKAMMKLNDCYIDPLEIQARKIIEFFGKKVRE